MYYKIQKSVISVFLITALKIIISFFGTANRKLSEKRGLKVWLCGNHHRNGPSAVHRNRQFDLQLKEMAQTYYEQNIGTREQFIVEFGKSYL